MKTTAITKMIRNTYETVTKGNLDRNSLALALLMNVAGLCETEIAKAGSADGQIGTKEALSAIDRAEETVSGILAGDEMTSIMISGFMTLVKAKIEKAGEPVTKGQAFLAVEKGARSLYDRILMEDPGSQEMKADIDAARARIDALYAGKNGTVMRIDAAQALLEAEEYAGCPGYRALADAVFGILMTDRLLSFDENINPRNLRYTYTDKPGRAGKYCSLSLSLFEQAFANGGKE